MRRRVAAFQTADWANPEDTRWNDKDKNDEFYVRFIFLVSGALFRNFEDECSRKMPLEKEENEVEFWKAGNTYSL